jgi:hypothetical protein
MAMTDESLLYDAFDDCLTRLGLGESVADCLKSYPDLSEELRPMLEAAQVTWSISRVPHHVQRRSRSRFLTILAQATARRSPRLNAWGMLFQRVVTTTLTLAVGFTLGTTGLYYASASTLPGDSLYGVKRAFEDTWVQLAVSPQQRLELEEQYNAVRETEVEQLLTTGANRNATVSFGGPFSSATSAEWHVGGFDVYLADDTKISGVPQPGFYVSVVAQMQNGKLVAGELTVEEMEITGLLAGGGDQWQINGVSFAVTAQTTVNGQLAPGATATARVRSLRPGDRVAVSVTVLAEPTALPTDTPTATSSSTVTRTPTTVPTDTLEPTDTKSPSKTPLPTVEPSKTPGPGVESSETPKPGETKESTEAPEPTERREATETPKPESGEDEHDDSTREPRRTRDP